MSAELQQTISEVANWYVATGAAVGLGAGAVAKTVANNFYDKRVEAASVDLGQTNDKAFIPESRYGTLANNSRTLLAGLALVSGGLAGNALMPTQNEQRTNALEIVVDHSAATSYPNEVGKKTAAQEISEYVTSFYKNDKVKSTGHVTFGSKVVVKPAKEVSSVPRQGDVVMGQAFDSALNDANATAERADATVNDKPAIAVLTNGNILGRVESVVSRAEANKVKVNIINVNPGASKAQEKNLSEVAKKTGGVYRSTANGPVNVEKITNEIVDSTNPKPEITASKNRLIPAGLAVLIGGFCIGLTRQEAKHRSVRISKIKGEK